MRAQRAGLIGVVLSLAGIGLCAYLTVVHIALLRGDLFGGSACGAEGTWFDCHAVTASPFGSVFGIPLAMWGLIGYLATLSWSLIAWQLPEWSVKALAALAGASLLFLAVDLVLLAVMLTTIRYLCPLCLASYAVNLLLLLLAKRAIAAPWRQVIRQAPSAMVAWLPKSRVAASWVFWGIVATGAAGTLAVHAATTFTIQGSGPSLEDQVRQFVSQQRPVSVETANDPLMGAPRGTAQVVEFSDFLCPSCQRASRLNRIFLASHRQDAAFVFKQFPLDAECNPTVTRTLHQGACRLAAATECAHEQGKFWALHDRIFQEGPKYRLADLDADATRLGLDMTAFRACLDSGRGLEAVKRDVAEAGRLGVTSTPTYFINGIRTVGVFTPMAFEAFLRAIRRAGQDSPAP